MNSRFVAPLAVPLLALALGCGDTKTDVAPPSPFGLACKLQIRGPAQGVNEDLWCIVTAFDYGDLTPATPSWAFQLAAYRGTTQIGGGIGIFLLGRPALGTAYGWTAATSSVDSGSAMRATGDATVVPSTYVETHRALAPMLATAGTGAISVTFSRVPPPAATGDQLLDVHGALSGTLVAADGVSPPLTFSATF
jgi:hypothetical protein